MPKHRVLHLERSGGRATGNQAHKPPSIKCTRKKNNTRSYGSLKPAVTAPGKVVTAETT
jgi:hypothetical protein